MLQIRNLSVNYGESNILRDITLEVPAGQVVCLMGRNGAGKTTLMKSIMGLLRSQHGEILYNGTDITRVPTSKRARMGIGYVPQGRHIFPYLTVYENLLMGFEAGVDGIDMRLAIEEVYSLFPVLPQMRNRMAGTLSGGQQQQLAIARVLVRRPQLLLLDEPTEGIQPSIMLEIEELIRSLHETTKLSILLVEQFLDFALSVGHEYYIMDTGTIVQSGPISAFDHAAAKEFLSV